MLAGAYDESASYVGDALYRHARTTFALSIIPDGITMTMTAITIARRDRKRPALAALGWQHTHTSARRAVRQLGKLLTNNTASGITIRGVVVSDPIVKSLVLFAHNHPWDSGRSCSERIAAVNWKNRCDYRSLRCTRPWEKWAKRKENVKILSD